MTRLPDAPRFVLLSGPESNSGAVVTDGRNFEVLSGVIPFRLDHSEELVIRVPRGAPWLSSALPKQHVIRVEQIEHGITSEWVLSGMVEEKGKPYVEVHADPLDWILRDVGPMRDRVTGGGSYYSLGGVELTPTEYIDNFILPYLATLSGYSWITRGTIETDALHTITWDRWTPRRLIFELVSRTAYEFRFRRTGQIDLLERIGSSAPIVSIAAGKNLRALTKTTDPDGFASVVQAFGAIPEGGSERATMGLNFWVVSNLSGSTFTLSALNDGPGPWALNDQGNGLYVRKADGTFTQITDSATDGSTTVASASGIANGDYVMIVADSAGTLIEELEDPDAVARVVGTYANDDLRGEANFLANPWGNDGPATSGVVYARVATEATSGTSSISLKDIVPTNQAFSAGDMLTVLFPLGHPVCRITAPATASGGNVTLSVAPAVWAPTNLNNFFLYTNSPVAIFTGLAAGAPDSWTDAQLGTTSAAIFQPRDTTLTDLAGTIAAVGDFSVPVPPSNTSATWGGRVTVGGLAPGDVVQVGDALWFTDTAQQPYRFVIVGGTANGSGEVTVTLNGQRPTSTVGDDVQVVRPDFPDDIFRTPSSDVICLLAHRKNLSTDTELAGCVFDFPPVVLPHLPTAPNVYLKGGFTVRGDGAVNNAGAIRPLRLQLLDANGVVLREVVPPEFNFNDPSGSGPMFGDPRSHDVQIELSVGIALTEPLTVYPRVIGCYRSDTININTGHPFTFVRWLMLQVGSDDQAAPPIIGSHATKLWQAANDRLLLHRRLPEEIRVTASELVEHFGLTPAEAKLTLGGTVRLMDEETGTDDEYRVVEVVYSATDPSDTAFTLTTRLREAMAAIERRFKELGEGSTRTVSGSRVDRPAVVTAPPGTGGGTGGGTGSSTSRDIFVASFANPPTPPANFTPYWHIPDRGVYKKWQDGQWLDADEASRAMVRVAQVDGADLGAWRSWLEDVRAGETNDDDGNPIRIHPAGASADTIQVMVDNVVRYIRLDPISGASGAVTISPVLAGTGSTPYRGPGAITLSLTLSGAGLVGNLGSGVVTVSPVLAGLGATA